MDWVALGADARKLVQEVLGYLNFSSGTPDPKFLRSLNLLFESIESNAKAGSTEPTWRVLDRVILQGLDALRGHIDAFREVEQAQGVLHLVWDELPGAYRKFHRDLLFHQTDEAIFTPFFLGRACEAVLAEGGPWNESERILPRVIARLNDFLGHRPVAVLRTAQKIQPYAHEWVRPIPLFIREAGVAVGRYHDVVAKALELLAATSEDLLEQAWFDLALLDELAADPRAYDFDHPVNRRPNYHFGGWDPHQIDRRGYYRRFVLQQVTLDSLWSRVAQREDLPYEERLLEAAAVLAGTMLMGSGVTGNRPETHDSGTTLANLLPHIAAYRDVFYDRLLTQLDGPHGERLREEARALKQPFGGARQHLNHALARRRAEQLQHVHLSQIFARMGFPEAAARQTKIVPVASARMRCEIACCLTASHLAIDRRQLAEAAGQLPLIEDLLHRAIECGAMVDPWNILGFGGQFSKFPAVEDSIHDHRVDELVDLMNEIFGLYARLEEEAAAAGDDALQHRLSENLAAMARWWDKYASMEVSDLEGVSGRQMWESAEQVATALSAWHRAGTAAGKIGFWREHADRFHSPKAYALLVEALLEQGDLVAAMALLMHWLSQADQIPLTEGDYSFHSLAIRWMEDLWQVAPAEDTATAHIVPPAERWALAKKFFDHLEANADQFWQVPTLEALGPASSAAAADDEEKEEEPSEDDADNLYSAAYENVIYRDTTDDGFEGEMLEGGAPVTDFELSLEAERIGGRLMFLGTIARLWKMAAAASASEPAQSVRDEVLAGWLAQVVECRKGLSELLLAVHRHRLPPPRSTHDSLVEYDHRRAIKENLLERIIAAAVETADAGRVIQASMHGAPSATGPEPWEEPAGQVLRALFRGDTAAVHAAWAPLLDALRDQPLLYLPLARGGNPQRILNSRSMQQVLRRLLASLPRLGLLTETYRLIETIQEMERNHPAGPGAITEFDRLFEIGCKAIIHCLVISSNDWEPPKRSRRQAKRPAEHTLTDVLERATEMLLRRWLAHSRNVRISVLETVTDRTRWRKLKEFIEHYGHDLFTQKFMNFGNLRAILHQGVDTYLRSLEEEPEDQIGAQLLEEIDRKIPRDEAVRWLETAIEAVVENYPEYIDYNSTTTQSDRGEMLYTLLDFLRLEASYDRVAWNLKPVVLAHQVLVRLDRSDAAVIWRDAVSERCATVADDHLQRLDRLVTKYGMRLPSVSDRLGERFVKPLSIDRLCALIESAVEESRHGGPSPAFELLEKEIIPFTQEPSGIGFDVPAWLEALETEVQRVHSGEPFEETPALHAPDVVQVHLPLAQVDDQLENWE